MSIYLYLYKYLYNYLYKILLFGCKITNFLSETSNYERKHVICLHVCMFANYYVCMFVGNHVCMFACLLTNMFAIFYAFVYRTLMLINVLETKWLV